MVWEMTDLLIWASFPKKNPGNHDILKQIKGILTIRHSKWFEPRSHVINRLCTIVRVSLSTRKTVGDSVWRSTNFAEVIIKIYNKSPNLKVIFAFQNYQKKIECSSSVSWNKDKSNI